MEVKLRLYLSQINHHLFVFLDNISALQSIWCIGDETLRSLEVSFKATVNQALNNEANVQQPYMDAYYNCHFYLPPKWDNPDSTLARFVNALAEGLNDKLQPHLFKYLLIIPDKDLIAAANMV